MLMRIVPCDLRGMERPAAGAIRAADTGRDFLTVTVRELLPVTDAERRESPAAVVVVVAGFNVVSVWMLPGVDGAVDVVDASGDVVGEVPGGATVVVVLDVDDDDELLDVVVVVVVETVRELTVAAAERSVWSFTPNWPSVFAPQHCTAPVAMTAHAWFAPVARSSTVPARPDTAAGARTFAPEVPLPTWPLRLLPQHCTPPVVINAQAWFMPATTLLMLPMTAVAAGVLAVEGETEPRPS